MADSFWDRKTSFWDEEEPATPKNAPESEGYSGVSRQRRRIRALSRRSKIATACALGSSAVALVVMLSGLASNDVARDPNGGRAARAPGGAQPRVPTLGPLGNLVPVASVTDAPLGPATPATAPLPGGGAPPPAPAGTAGGATGAPASSASSAPAPAAAPASAPAPAPTSPPPSPITTTPPLPPQPSCTIGLLGTCVVDGDGGLLP